MVAILDASGHRERGQGGVESFNFRLRRSADRKPLTIAGGWPESVFSMAEFSAIHDS
jgi:hypothetical protein